jgi:hypothetical protein
MMNARKGKDMTRSVRMCGVYGDGGRVGTEELEERLWLGAEVVK